MSAIFGFFFFFLFIILMIGLSLLGAVFRLFTGFRYRSKHTRESKNNESAYSYNNSSTSSSGTKKKVFDDDEGEYVDFEEIKDSDTKR